MRNGVEYGGGQFRAVINDLDLDALGDRWLDLIKSLLKSTGDFLGIFTHQHEG